MSNFGSIARYNAIIRFLKRRPHSTFEEISVYLKKQAVKEGVGNAYDISIRTFQRDKLSIEEHFNIKITCNRRDKTYAIEAEDLDHYYSSALYQQEVLRLLNAIDNVTPYVIKEVRNAKGTENIGEIADAIKKELRLSFTYHKFDYSAPQLRYIEPYVLKEFKNRL